VLGVHQVGVRFRIDREFIRARRSSSRSFGSLLVRWSWFFVVFLVGSGLLVVVVITIACLSAMALPRLANKLFASWFSVDCAIVGKFFRFRFLEKVRFSTWNFLKLICDSSFVLGLPLRGGLSTISFSSKKDAVSIPKPYLYPYRGNKKQMPSNPPEKGGGWSFVTHRTCYKVFAFGSTCYNFFSCKAK